MEFARPEWHRLGAAAFRKTGPSTVVKATKPIGHVAGQRADVANFVPKVPDQERGRVSPPPTPQCVQDVLLWGCPDSFDPTGVAVVDTSTPPGRDESAFLVGLLTAVCRPSLHLAPGLMLRAAPMSGAGSGKGLLARCICIVAFGREPHAVTGGGSADDLEKRIAAELIEGGPTLFLDNMNSMALKSDLLASAITERPARVRVLGKSQMVPQIAAADLRGLDLTRNSERGDAPGITRAIQDRIRRELRDMYAELLRQPLPDNLTAPLRASAGLSPRDVLEGAVTVLRSESPASSDATLTASLPKAKSA